MDYNGIRMYPIPHFPKYLISRNALLIEKETLTRILPTGYKKRQGPLVKVIDNENIEREVSIGILFMLCFYGYSKAPIKSRYPIEDLGDICIDNLYYDVTGFRRIDPNAKIIQIYDEEYRQIILNDEIVFINSEGAIYSYLKNKFLRRAYGTDNPYPIVDIGKRTCHVHRILASAFFEKFDPELFVNHKDGHKFNSYLENLEPITPKENVIHALKNGLVLGVKSTDQIHHFCQLLENGASINEIKHEMNWENVKSDTISRLIYHITSGKQWSFIASQYDLSQYRKIVHNHINLYNESQIRQICELLQGNPSLSNSEVAAMTNTTRSLVQNIRSGSQWKWVSKDYHINYEQSKRNLSPEEVEQVFKLHHEKNLRPGEIVEKLEYIKDSAQVITLLQGKSKISREFVEKYGQYNRCNNFTSEDDIRLICKLHCEGLSDADINKKVPHVLRQTINDIVLGKHHQNISSQYGIKPYVKYDQYKPGELLENPERTISSQASVIEEGPTTIESIA